MEVILIQRLSAIMRSQLAVTACIQSSYVFSFFRISDLTALGIWSYHHNFPEEKIPRLQMQSRFAQ